MNVKGMGNVCAWANANGCARCECDTRVAAADGQSHSDSVRQFRCNLWPPEATNRAPVNENEIRIFEYDRELGNIRISIEKFLH